jgi:hypothetical protein
MFSAQESSMNKSTITLAGTIQKLIDCSALQQPQQAQISLADAGYLYDELRIANTHGWEEGTTVEVTIRRV